MPSPVELLRQLGFNLPDPAQSQPLAPGEDMPGSKPSWLDVPLEAGLGFLGVGADSKANRFGQMAGAAVPAIGGLKTALGGLRGASVAREAAGMARPPLTGAFLDNTIASGRNIFNPETAAVMERMHQQNRPVVQAMENAGAFSGDRSVGGLHRAAPVSGLGGINPEFTPVGGEATLNAGRPQAPQMADPQMAAFHRVLARGGR